MARIQATPSATAHRADASSYGVGLLDHLTTAVLVLDRGSVIERMIGPRHPLRMEPVNVHEVTERVRALVRAEAPSSIVVERDYDPSIPDLAADPELLIQAMLNIARNAVHVLGDGGRIVLRTPVQRRVSIGARHHRLACRIDVSDDGPASPTISSTACSTRWSRAATEVRVSDCRSRSRSSTSTEESSTPVPVFFAPLVSGRRPSTNSS